jgi:hypothetical protein
MQNELHKETRKKRNQITVETKLCTFVARLFLSQEGFYPHALPCMQRFRAFFAPLLGFSFPALESTQRKEAQCARQPMAE